MSGWGEYQPYNNSLSSTPAVPMSAMTAAAGAAPDAPSVGTSVVPGVYQANWKAPVQPTQQLAMQPAAAMQSIPAQQFTPQQQQPVAQASGPVPAADTWLQADVTDVTGKVIQPPSSSSPGNFMIPQANAAPTAVGADVRRPSGVDVGFVDDRSSPANPVSPAKVTADLRSQGLAQQPASSQALQQSATAVPAAASGAALDRKAFLSFKNVSYTVNAGKTAKDGTSLAKKVVDNVSGFAKPGEVTGIIGPSGCGKTSLLDLLAQRLVGNVEGDVMINGAPAKSLAGGRIWSYVQKEDALVGTVTVRSSFKFAADLKLNCSVAEKEAIIDATIKDLGLDSCQNTKIGNVYQKGISGGQMRRVSIGLEIINQPPLLLLDEPTSGLDASAAYNVIEALRRLAKRGMTVICAMHQPSTEVFDLLDTVMVLSKGKPTYFGSVRDMVPYLGRAGHQCPRYSNPADYVIGLINDDFKNCDAKAVSQLVGLFQSETVAMIDKEIATMTQGGLPPLQKKGYAIGIHKQFWHIFVRQSIDNVVNPGVFWVRVAMYVMLSFMIGTLYLDIGDDQSNIQDRFYLIYFVHAFFVFMSIAVIPAVIQDLHVFTRERSNGWYAPIAYVLSSSLSCLPGLCLIAILCTSIIYPLVGMNGATGRFGLFFVNLFTAFYCAEAIVSMLSALIPIYIIAMAFGAGIYGMFMLGEGGLVLPGNIPDWWIWNYYIAMHTYGFESMIWTEFDGATFNCCAWTDTSCALIERACPFPDGASVLKVFEMEDMDIDTVSRDMGIVVAMGVFYRLVFWAILQFRARYKGQH